MRGPVVAPCTTSRAKPCCPKAERQRARQAGVLGRPHAGTAHAMFVTRDNQQHTNDIERHYRVALRAARSRVVIANAYFFPGYRFIRCAAQPARCGCAVDPAGPARHAHRAHGRVAAV